jgi:hypothetical protein
MCEMYSTQISTIQSGFFILDIVLYWELQIRRPFGCINEFA